MQLDYQYISMRNGQSGISYTTDRLLPGETVMDTFSDRLKRIRKERGLSQVELCEKIGIKQNQYSRYENGVVPETDLLIKFSIALECSTDYLLALVDDPKETVQYENMPTDDQNIVQLYRAAKRGDQISRSEIKVLRDLNVVDESDRPAIEAPQEPDIPGEQKATNR